MKKFPISEIGLSTRAWRCLESARIYYVGDLENLSERAITRVPGLGRKSVQEILEVCDSWGIELLDEKINRIAKQYQQLKDIELNNIAFVRGDHRDIELLKFTT